MSKNTYITKSMLLVGTLLLAGCASAPTLDFLIPNDKIDAFNKCMVPAHLEKLGENKDGVVDEEFWLNGS